MPKREEELAKIKETQYATSKPPLVTEISKHSVKNPSDPSKTELLVASGYLQGNKSGVLFYPRLERSFVDKDFYKSNKRTIQLQNILLK